MTLPEYLKLHEGARWNYEQSAFVLAHVAEVERTYRAMLDEALAKVEAAATEEPSPEACKHPRGALDNSHFHMNAAQGEIVAALEKHGLSPCDAIKAASDALSIAWTTWNDMAKIIEMQDKILEPAKAEPAGTLVTAAKIDMEELAVRLAESMLGIARPPGMTAHDALMRGFEPHYRAFIQEAASVAVRFIVDSVAAAGGGVTAEIRQMEEHHA